MKKFIRYFIGVVCWLATLLANISLVRFIALHSNSNLLDAIVAFIGGMIALSSVPIAARLIVGQKVWGKYSPPKRKEDDNDDSVHKQKALTLKEFLLHHTQTNELCAITVAGWVQAMAHIDHEDRFIYALPDKLLNRTVKSDHWDTFFPIVNASGQAVPTPVHYIEIGD